MGVTYNLYTKNIKYESKLFINFNVPQQRKTALCFWRYEEFKWNLHAWNYCQMQ